MNCKCGSTRFISLNAKHSDMCQTRIDHLGVDVDGYGPRLGIFGGDYTSFTVCMDCGTIRGWKPISDEDVSELYDTKSIKNRHREFLDDFYAEENE